MLAAGSALTNMYPLEVLEPPLSIEIDGILGVFTKIELLLQLLRRSGEGFGKALETHGCMRCE